MFNLQRDNHFGLCLTVFAHLTGAFFNLRF